MTSDNILKVDGKIYNRNDIAAPLPSESTSLVRMKNEFVFARQAVMDAQEQRLLYNCISRFDTSGFREDGLVIEQLWSKEKGGVDFGNINQRICDQYFCTMERRTLLLPIYDTLLAAGTRNYEMLEPIIEKMAKRDLTVVTKNADGDKDHFDRINLIERIRKVSVDGQAAEVLITFTQAFMPYVIALSGYKAVELEMLSKLKQKYSLRYYHWFLHSLGNKQKSAFTISVSELRERFKIGADEHKRGFFERIVKKPILDINERADIDVSAERLTENTKRGKEIKAIRFTIERKTLEQKKQEALDAMGDNW